MNVPIVSIIVLPFLLLLSFLLLLLLSFLLVMSLLLYSILLVFLLVVSLTFLSVWLIWWCRRQRFVFTCPFQAFLVDFFKFEGPVDASAFKVVY